MNYFDYLSELAGGIRATLQITFGAFTIGLVVAVPVTAARRSSSRALRFVGTSYVELVRAVPPLPWLFVAYFALPTYGVALQPVEAGIVVFGVISSAYITEIYRAGFRSVPIGQAEASSAVGLGRFDTYRIILIPQAVRTMLPLSIAYLIGALKDSAVVSAIGATDITQLAVVQNQATSDGLTIFAAAATLYILFSVPVAVFGRWLARRLQVTTPVGA